jgi:selenocysteine lyase/cysteine desulfurase
MCSGGSFYSQRCLKGQGVDVDHGVLRVSFVHYTSQSDVTRLIGALDEII